MPLPPNTIPGRAYQVVNRTSRALFHWRAADLGLAALTGQTPTFVRASAGGLLAGGDGKLRNFGQYETRFELYDLDGDGIREAPGLLLEGQRSNLVVRSETFSHASWTVVGTPTVVSGAFDPMGGTGAFTLGDDDAAAAEAICIAIVFTGDGEKAASLFVKQGSAAYTTLQIYDATAVAARHTVLLTWGASGPVLTTSGGAGALFPAQALANGWWRVGFSAQGVVAANTNRLYIYPAGANNVTNVGTTLCFGAQAEDGPFPSSYIRSDGGSATQRNADALSFAISFDSFDRETDDFTLYAAVAKPWWMASSATFALGPGVGRLGNGTRGLQAYFNSVGPAFGPRAQINDGAGNPGTVAATRAAGETQEFVAQFRDLITGGYARVDAGAGWSAESTQAAGISSFAAATLELGNIGAANPTFAAFLSFKLARGLFTLDQMREVF